MAEHPRDLEAEVTALKIVAGLTLIELGKRDPELLENIIAQLSRGAATGATPIFPELGAFQVALQNFLDELGAVKVPRGGG